MMYAIMDQRVNEDTIRSVNDPVRIARRQLKSNSGNPVRKVGSLGLASLTAVAAAAMSGIVARTWLGA